MCELLLFPLSSSRHQTGLKNHKAIRESLELSILGAQSGSCNSRVTLNLSPHPTPSPDLAPLSPLGRCVLQTSPQGHMGQPYRTLCRQTSPKVIHTCAVVHLHMLLSPQLWQRSLPMQQTVLNTETPNWQMLRASECPARGEASPSSPSRLSGTMKKRQEELGSQKTEKSVLVLLGVDPVCWDWKGLPSCFLVRCQACSEEESHCRCCKPGQEPTAQEVMGPTGD